jgi:hypothetical protein
MPPQTTAAATPAPSTRPTASPQASQADATPAAFTTGGALGAIVWTTAVDPVTKAPTGEVASFTPTAATIYAAIPVIRIDAGTTLSAAWVYNDTPVESLSTTMTAASPLESAWVEFNISRAPDAPWPTGRYQVTISVNGEAALTSEVLVQPGSE